VSLIHKQQQVYKDYIDKVQKREIAGIKPILTKNLPNSKFELKGPVINLLDKVISQPIELSEITQ
jgi:hypothetical protein